MSRFIAVNRLSSPEPLSQAIDEETNRLATLYGLKWFMGKTKLKRRGPVSPVCGALATTSQFGSPFSVSPNDPIQVSVPSSPSSESFTDEDSDAATSYGHTDERYPLDIPVSRSSLNASQASPEFGQANSSFSLAYRFLSPLHFEPLDTGDDPIVAPKRTSVCRVRQEISCSEIRQHLSELKAQGNYCLSKINARSSPRLLSGKLAKHETRHHQSANTPLLNLHFRDIGNGLSRAYATKSLPRRTSCARENATLLHPVTKIKKRSVTPCSTQRKPSKDDQSTIGLYGTVGKHVAARGNAPLLTDSQADRNNIRLAYGAVAISDSLSQNDACLTDNNREVTRGVALRAATTLVGLGVLRRRIDELNDIDVENGRDSKSYANDELFKEWRVTRARRAVALQG